MFHLDAHGIVVVDSTFSECRASIALVFVSLSARERVLFVCFSGVSRLDRQRQFAACLLLACFFCSLFAGFGAGREVLDRFLLAFFFLGGFLVEKKSLCLSSVCSSCFDPRVR
jgi:hypothetical protein